MQTRHQCHPADPRAEGAKVLLFKQSGELRALEGDVVVEGRDREGKRRVATTGKEVKRTE